MKLPFTIAFLFIIQLTLAQNNQDQKAVITKGTQNISLKFNTSFIDEETGFNEINSGEKNKSIGLNSSYAYAFAENWTIGAAIQYQYLEIMEVRNNDMEEISEIKRFYGISLEIKKYWSVGEKLLLNLGGGAGYGFSNIYGQYDKGSVLSVGIRPGVTYFLNPHFALEANLGFIGYSYTVQEQENDYTDDYYSEHQEIVADFNSSQIRLGLSYYF